MEWAIIAVVVVIWLVFGDDILTLRRMLAERRRKYIEDDRRRDDQLAAERRASDVRQLHEMAEECIALGAMSREYFEARFRNASFREAKRILGYMLQDAREIEAERKLMATPKWQAYRRRVNAAGHVFGRIVEVFIAGCVAFALWRMAAERGWLAPFGM